MPLSTLGNASRPLGANEKVVTASYLYVKRMIKNETLERS